MKNLPPDYNHIGFVIANNEEEFIHSFKRRPGYSLLYWTITPAFAQVFKSSEMASNVITLIDHYSKLWILDLFESSDSLVVATDVSDRPRWLPVVDL